VNGLEDPISHRFRGDMPMPQHPTILDGSALAKTLEEQLALRVQTLVNRSYNPPTLATILIEDDPSSATRRLSAYGEGKFGLGHLITQKA
jgi:hypothetical protein